ncbi:antibiotic biosynthesis monooxygenase [Pseudoduganella sp. FT55W]|uniref:Antibiotic biosynthesis monooxygenase n=1 Tax=Duganella rivi TaxID=2666083 RepID=A0A7X4KBT4_9BURK|nr:putative quinol monooxygenase [Duganella rivi]MYM67282.1 antibiotic biosynthesis monooxygenase [Duganella rivi]
MFKQCKAALIGGMAAALAVAAAPAAAESANAVNYKAVPAGAYSIVAQIKAKPGKEAALRQITLPLIKQVRSDPKNIVYFLQENREKPGHFIFYEIFATKADFEAHNAMPYVKDWFAKLPELADGGVEVMRMEVLK